MKRFKFRLEPVEKVRKRSEEDAVRTLAEARRRLGELVAQGDVLQAGLEAALARREALGSEPVSPAAFQVEQDFIAGTKLRIAQLAIRVSKAQRGVEKATKFFMHARRQLRVIERLREREHEAFRRAVTKDEQKKIDEMVVMRAGRAAQGDES